MTTKRITPPLADTPRHRALASVSRAGILGLVRAETDGVTAAQVARTSGLHLSTVRAHLDQLAEASLVVREADRDGSPGRPAWRYRAIMDTEPVDSLYRGLAAALVNHLARAEANPAAAGEQAGRDWGRQLARGSRANRTRGGRRTHPAKAAHTRPAGQPVDRPIDGLIDVLAELGFSPQVVPHGDDQPTAVVSLRTCPFMDLVAANPDVVCGLHLGVIRGVLGGFGAATSGTELEPFGLNGTCVVRVATRERPARP